MWASAHLTLIAVLATAIVARPLVPCTNPACKHTGTHMVAENLEEMAQMIPGYGAMLDQMGVSQEARRVPFAQQTFQQPPVQQAPVGGHGAGPMVS
jgi:hypothetical protein